LQYLDSCILLKVLPEKRENTHNEYEDTQYEKLFFL